MHRPSLTFALGALQAIVVIVALTIAPLVPPADGMIVLAPITGASLGQVIMLAREHDATIIGAGPWRGSIVVAGHRHALFATMTRAGVLMLAARGTACGDKSA